MFFLILLFTLCITFQIKIILIAVSRSDRRCVHIIFVLRVTPTAPRRHRESQRTRGRTPTDIIQREISTDFDKCRFLWALASIQNPPSNKQDRTINMHSA